MSLNAILPLNKPYGWSSFDAIRYAQRIIKRATGEQKFKIGHAGTLDPLATGLLIICVGAATKQAEQLQAEVKEYRAGIRLGATTPSFDLETEPCFCAGYEHIARSDIDAQLSKMLGRQQQLPPQFSAKQVDGQRAYTLARQGIEANVKPNTITIYEIEVETCEPPQLNLRVLCSKGTYIRTLAHDIGRALGCGAYLNGLQRTASGELRIDQSITPDKIFTFFSPIAKQK